MHATIKLLPVSLAAIALAASVSAQTIPFQWNRSAEWVTQPSSSAGTTLGNPSPDSAGNLVWNYEWIKSFSSTPTFIGTVRTTAKWSDSPPLWVDMWVSPALGARMESFRLTDDLNGATGPQWQQKPVVRWENVFGQTLKLDVIGTLRLGFFGMFTPLGTPTVDVVIAMRDDSAGINVITPLFVGLFEKPTPVSTPFPEFIDIPIDLNELTLDPNDSLLISFQGFPSTNGIADVELDDSALQYYTSDSAAAETVLLGLPPNPNALLPGMTSGPIIGETWDPIIDHTSFAPGATLDYLAISLAAPINVPTVSKGTILIDWSPGDPIFLQPPGLPFLINVPDDSTLIGLEFIAQGASFTPGSGLELTNALDVLLGSH